MTDEQYYAHLWLSRMWNIDTEINALKERAETISGARITTYEAQESFGGSDGNPTESKNIEFSMLMAEIEKKTQILARENNRTFEVIQKLTDSMFRGMIYSRYILRKSWTQIGKEYNYERSQAFEYRKKVLDAVYEFVPKEVITDEVN